MLSGDLLVLLNKVLLGLEIFFILLIYLEGSGFNLVIVVVLFFLGHLCLYHLIRLLVPVHFGLLSFVAVNFAWDSGPTATSMLIVSRW